MQKRSIAIPLYLFNIIVCVIIEFYVQTLVALLYVLYASICILIGFFVNKVEFRLKPGLQRFFHPNVTSEHIIMPLVFLILILFPLIFFLFSPEFGLSLLSIWAEINVPIFLIFSSFPLGTILSLPKELVPIDKTSEG